ncbi:MAG: hypothetical protein GY773_22415, partial [Actinomycetia bacterium]|nr:hypothetical protein [Actinomycetes bacterium]
PIQCADLGAGGTTRKWASTIDGTVAKFEHCTLGGALSDMQPMVGYSDNLSLVRIFTTKYLERDKALKKRVTGS